MKRIIDSAFRAGTKDTSKLEEIKKIVDFYSRFADIDAEEELRSILEKKRLFKVARIVNKRLDINQLRSIVDGDSVIASYDDALLLDERGCFNLSRSSEFTTGKLYILSFPSYLVIKALLLDDVEYALDVCAAPGGKGLFLYDRLERRRPVILNEPSSARRRKMLELLKLYGAEELALLSIDGARLCRFVRNEIPLILADVPCSGEAHILSSPKRLRSWSPRQTKVLSTRQFAILSSAIYAIKVGAAVLYTTCTMSPYENEYVIERVFDKFKDAVELDELNLPEIPFAADLRPLSGYDRRLLRFRASEFGLPFFAALIRKKKELFPQRPAIRVPVEMDGRVVSIGRRRYALPQDWPALPALPYVSLGFPLR